MKTYWKDIKETGDRWAGIILTVEDKLNQRPSIHLQVGGNSRIRLSHHKRAIFWATAANDYSGVWLVRAFTEVKKNDMSIMPIRSSEIQTHTQLSHLDWLKSWCYFFTRELTENQASFLYNGPWIFKTHVPISPNDWNYKRVETTKHTGGTNIYDVKHSFDDNEVMWLNWWCNGSGRLISVQKPDKHSGRVK
ncbi:hypothetical protein MNBD_GAMMA12-3596 [hydrothermal vent metagenome]|uniref:Uncharacterized protein n=1 Tax=hydrothermal vent metagenome TaxID=652676 RepID=A0A3B0Z036_9ZZZZ